MSGTAPTQKPATAAPATVTIGRLVLAVPGLGPDQVNQLATRVASHLARGYAPVGDVVVPRLAVALNPAETSIEQIARAIARAIRAAPAAGAPAAPAKAQGG